LGLRAHRARSYFGFDLEFAEIKITGQFGVNSPLSRVNDGVILKMLSARAGVSCSDGFGTQKILQKAPTRQTQYSHAMYRHIPENFR
jgi:hypothetical protein